LSHVFWFLRRIGDLQVAELTLGHKFLSDHYPIFILRHPKNTPGRTAKKTMAIGPKLDSGRENRHINQCTMCFISPILSARAFMLAGRQP
jgi:hypothetical protein